MKKHTILLFTFLGLFLFSTPVHAFKHGYTINTDKIYAMVRHDLAVYSSPGGDFLTYLPSFSGVTVIGSTSSWYENPVQSFFRHPLWLGNQRGFHL